MRMSCITNPTRAMLTIMQVASVALLLLLAYKLAAPSWLQPVPTEGVPPTAALPAQQPSLQAAKTEADTSPVMLSAPSLPPGTCLMYGELRQVNFLHASLRHRLCRGATAYAVANGAFPLCELPEKLPEVLTAPVAFNSTVSHLVNPVTGRRAPIYVYSSPDMISNSIRNSHSFEARNVRTVMTLAQKLNTKSPIIFLDVGCNVGVFSVSALEMGFPVVALDANIRNLLRVRMSAQAAGKSSLIRLLWNFISRQVSLMYLNFPKDCNIGGATKFARAVTDTIPVMSTTADAVVPMINTKTVVMKVDIEGGEGEFFRSASELFRRFTVPVVHMEWLKRHMTEEERLFMITFFRDRNYTPRSTADLNRQVSVENASVEGDDLIWIRKDYIANGSFVVPN